MAIGFSLGLAHLPLVPVVIALAAQAFAAAQLGSRIAERYRELAEHPAGLAIGLYLIIEHPRLDSPAAPDSPRTPA